MNRRTLLKTGGMALVGAGFGGCASRTTPSRTPARRPAVNLPPVDISWDRIIRTTVGLRPHRRSGFLLRGAKLDGKLLVHNYGHGGAGHSLGWGTGQMAAEIALEHGARTAAVIGCGTVGLTTARQMQRRGFDVTIYAAAMPPDTTSNMALAGFTPTSGLVSGGRTPEWDDQFRRAVQIAYRELQFLTGPLYGVSWVDTYNPRERPPAPRSPDEDGEAQGEGGLLPPGVQTGSEVLGPGEHPFDMPYAVRSPGIRIEPSIYLDALVRDFVLFGGRLVIRKFDSVRDIASLTEPVIVNCTGLGARELFDDQEMLPIKGQLTVLVPQPEVDYATFGGSRGPTAPGVMGIHMMPRGDGIALGGTSERGVWTLEPNEDARRAVVEGHIELFHSMHPPDPRQRLTASRTPSSAPEVESFFGLPS